MAQQAKTETLVELVNLGVPAPLKSLQNSVKYGAKGNQVTASLIFERDGKTYSIPVTVGLGFDPEKSQGYFSLEDAKGFISTSENFDGESFTLYAKANLSVERDARNQSTDSILGAIGIAPTKRDKGTSRPKTGDGSTFNEDSKLFFKTLFKLLAASNGVITVNQSLSFKTFAELEKAITEGKVRITEAERKPEPTAIFPGEPNVKVWNIYALKLKVNRKA